MTYACIQKAYSHSHSHSSKCDSEILLLLSVRIQALEMELELSVSKATSRNRLSCLQQNARLTTVETDLLLIRFFSLKVTRLALVENRQIYYLFNNFNICHAQQSTLHIHSLVKAERVKPHFLLLNSIVKIADGKADAQ